MRTSIIITTLALFSSVAVTAVPEPGPTAMVYPLKVKRQDISSLLSEAESAFSDLPSDITTALGDITSLAESIYSQVSDELSTADLASLTQSIESEVLSAIGTASSDVDSLTSAVASAATSIGSAASAATASIASKASSVASVASATKSSISASTGAATTTTATSISSGDRVASWSIVGMVVALVGGVAAW